MIKKIYIIFFSFASICHAAEEIKKQTDGEYVEETPWIHDFHSTVSDSVYMSAAWFDEFFTEEGSAQQNPKVNARIRLEWRPRSRDWNEIKARFRVKVKLPHFKNKVDLILSDEDEADQYQLPLETTHTQPEEEKFSASLRYMHTNGKNKYTDTRLGISGGDIFIRGRHKRYFNWTENSAFKVEPSIFYFLGDGLGSRLLLEYNFQEDPKTQYRINYSIEGSQSFSGIRWKHGFYRLKHLDAYTASVTSFQVEGERNGERDFVVDNYTVSYRYRFNAYKKWLFFEVEPFLEWSEIESYKTTPGIAFRVEGYFYKG
ncbi:hypothetical protein [Pseudocolwellia sp. HL-MZ7]|uniref:hypothetical protein n=1 Tax=Pseudocolwellia sp. HL-MZ7 TaxID=3400627 RepID=UPI003CEB0272